ncbi:4'-phosphopantetheinyl transferase family protein [Devriesea agamarum]|uniref:hypothetical protein n=1 Tax=Devriesea agamarum TaxID=472569 RepID=UPI00155EB863|nr:hypothetical protein [Devriesea agamarum]
MTVRQSGQHRDQFGHHTSGGGRYLLQTVATARGVPAGEILTRDPDQRWWWPGAGMHGSVSHCGRWGGVALSDHHIGIDLQDHRHRPAALGYLAEILRLPAHQPATIAQFAESEALIKMSGLSVEDFRDVQLPGWTSGWRKVQGVGWVQSRPCDVGVLALAAAQPEPVRWWSGTLNRRLGLRLEPTPIPSEGLLTCP